MTSGTAQLDLFPDRGRRVLEAMAEYCRAHRRLAGRDAEPKSAAAEAALERFPRLVRLGAEARP